MLYLHDACWLSEVNVRFTYISEDGNAFRVKVLSTGGVAGPRPEASCGTGNWTDVKLTLLQHAVNVVVLVANTAGRGMAWPSKLSV